MKQTICEIAREIEDSLLHFDAKLGVVPSYVRRKAALARLVGVSRQRLHYHTRQPGFPKPDGAGRYKTAEFLAYARTVGLPPWGEVQ